MDKPDLDELERLLNASTSPVPWKLYRESCRYAPTHYSPEGREGTELRIGTVEHHPQLKGPEPVVTTCDRWTNDDRFKHGIFISEQDGALIVAAVNALPGLIAALRERQAATLDAAVSEQQKEIAEAWKQSHYWELKDFESQVTIARQSDALAGARNALTPFATVALAHNAQIGDTSSKPTYPAASMHDHAIARAAILHIDQVMK